MPGESWNYNQVGVYTNSNSSSNRKVDKSLTVSVPLGILEMETPVLSGDKLPPGLGFSKGG